MIILKSTKMAIGKITVEQIGPALILSDATDYIIKELEDQKIWRSVLIEMRQGASSSHGVYPFIVTHPQGDDETRIAAYRGIQNYVIKSNEDFEFI